MPVSRRRFLSGALPAVAAGSLLPDEKVVPAEKVFTMHPVAVVEKSGRKTSIRVIEKYADALLGLDGWSHVNVFYWFDKNDVPRKRGILRVHPRGKKENPLTGVFACRAPVRPNLIALSLCRILGVEGNVVRIDGIDAFDGTPVIDLKPFTPNDRATEDVAVPAWAKRKR